MKRLMFFVVDDRFFLSHFLARAKAAQAAGFEVSVLAREGEHADAIRAEGIRFLPLSMRRNGFNPLRESGVLWEIARAFHRERPDVLHQAGIRPILYGTFVARLLRLVRMRSLINAPVGMGFVYSSDHWQARLLRPLISTLLRFLLHPPGAVVVFENPDDLRANARAGNVREPDCVLIRGAGVDTTAYRPHAPADETPVVTLAARMLRDKGVREFADAARILKQRGVTARFRLAGGTDPVNPTSFREETLRGWQDEGIVEWLGHCSDMPGVWAGTDIACLPSYREGLPKALLEALACGLPVVATDVPGCRETVEPGVNGLLVPAREAAPLADALERLLVSKELRERFGRRSREKAVAEFADAVVVAATLGLYRRAASLDGCCSPSSVR